MIYPENFEQKIGFNKVRQQLKDRTLGEIGKEICETFSFTQSFDQIDLKLDQTIEFIDIINGENNLPLEYVLDVRRPLSRCRIEGQYLDIDELFSIKRAIETVRAICNFFRSREPEELPALRKVVKDLQDFPYIQNRIDSILTKHGKIKDNASPELRSIRSEMISKQSQVGKTVLSILKRVQSEGLVDQDISVSIRDGRSVIPMPAAHKRKIKGIVHDESATGKTAFIEPVEVVELNNAIRELDYAERREIVKILLDITNDIKPYAVELSNSSLIVGELDFIRAKARLSIDFRSIKPKLHNYSCMDFKDARHPLLEQNLKKEKREIVPLDINVNRENRIILISGPNAGGKSVCLKTTGLLQYMLQSGLPIPVKDSSHAGIFDSIFIDIGDEQSIDNDLSTYSSHLLNMKNFTKNATDKTLILIDEFGTGTEPMLGGAIAEAVLNNINQTGVYGVITTHYTNLKHFASSAEGIVNGAMLYNSHQMEPLFRLSIGKPGSSFAFEIARKIGLSESILQEAIAQIGEDHINFDKHLREITRDKRYWEEKRRKIRQQEKRIEELEAQYEKDLSETRSLRREIITKAKDEAESIISKSNKIVEKTIREIKESQADKERTKKARVEIVKFKEKLEQEKNNDNKQIDKKIEQLKARAKRKENRKKREVVEPQKRTTPKKEVFEPGDRVKLKDSNTKGDIIEIKGKNIIVAFGSIKSTVKSDRLEIITKFNDKPKSNKGAMVSSLERKISEKRLTFKSEIDIRGKYAEEAILLVQAFIDEAIMAEANEVRILHGKGSGALKTVIRQYLSAEPAISSFKDEHVQNGGSGITVAYL